MNQANISKFTLIKSAYFADPAILNPKTPKAMHPTGSTSSTPINERRYLISGLLTIGVELTVFSLFYCRVQFDWAMPHVMLLCESTSHLALTLPWFAVRSVFVLNPTERITAGELYLSGSIIYDLVEVEAISGLNHERWGSK